MAEILQAAKDVICNGNSEAIYEFYYGEGNEANKKSLGNLESKPGYMAIKNNFDLILEICEPLTGRTEELRDDPELFENIERIMAKIGNGLQKLLDDCDGIADDKVLTACVFRLIKLCLESASPILMSLFHWTLTHDDIPWKKLSTDERLEYYSLLRKQLPKVVVKLPKKNSGEKLDHKWNGFLRHIFVEILGLYKPKKLEEKFQDALVTVSEYVIERILELEPETDDRETTYHLMFNDITEICMVNPDFGVKLMPYFQQIQAADFDPDESIVLVTNLSMKLVIEKFGVTATSSIQTDIDVFIKNCDTDKTTPTPEVLVQAYEKEQEVIHKNLERLLSKLSEMLVQNAMKIYQLAKLVAIHKPELLTEKMLACIYPGLSNDILCYFAQDCLSVVAQSYPDRVDAGKIIAFGERHPEYMHTTAEMLGAIGTSDTATKKKAHAVIEWLLKQIKNPVNAAHRSTMLTAAQAVGHKHQDQLMKFKPFLEELNKDAALKDVTRGLLNYLEGKSLEDAYKNLDEQAEDIQNLTEDVADVKDKVELVDAAVKMQAEDLAAAVADLAITKDDVKNLRQSVDKILVDVERVDKRIANATPKWCQSVANLLNPKSNNDWIALALRLNYVVEDVAAWGTLEDPCMGLLVEWYATHKNSEATRALYIVLKDLARDDAAEIVAKALEDAGEMVPVDEPLDIKHPPAIFISYQWGVQEKAKVIKDFLTNAGFSCWMDIGQMGGGDKLYEKIDNGIRGAKAIISLVTEKYATSINCNKEVNLCVTLQKPMFQLLMESMKWPPAGAMGPIFAEYLFVRFFLRGKEQNKSGNSWPEAKMEELLMQLRLVVEPDPKLVSKQMDDWWLEKTGNAVIGEPMPLAPPASQVFISYQWGKQTEVKELYERLTSLGFSCWLDIMQMGGGDSLYDKIDSGIRSCKLVLCCVTEKYSLSVNCRREVSLASATEKKIIPLLLESTRYPPAGPMSVPLAELQFLDFSKQSKIVEGAPYDALLAKLNSYFNGETGQPQPAKNSTSKKPDQKSKKAEEPAKSSSCLIL